MAVPLTLSSVPAQTPYVQYVSSAGQTVFPYPFEITQDSDLVVLINGVQQATDGGYTLSGQGNTTGGFLTFTVGQTAGTIITLYRNIVIARITQFAQNGTFFSANFNNEFNRIYLIMQQLQESLLPGGTSAFALMVPNSNSPQPTTLLTPASYANKYLSFDAFGNPQPALLTSSGSLTASIITGLTSPTTAAETAAGVTVINYGYAIGCVDRYGTNTTPGSTDMTTAMNAAAAVCMIAGGKLSFGSPALYLVTSPINLTVTGGPDVGGVLVEGFGGNDNGFGILANHTGVAVFDCTGNDGVKFRDICIHTTGSSPKTGILTARNAGGGSLITRYENVRILGSFSVAPFYNYGSEDDVHIGCYYWNTNTAAGTACAVFTATNIFGLVSPFTTIGSGSYSCIDHDLVACLMQNSAGTNTSDCIYIDVADSVKLLGGWYDSSSGSAAGRSIVYVDTTNGSSNFGTISAITCEHSGTVSQANVLCVGNQASANLQSWSLRDVRGVTSSYTVAASGGNTTLSGLFVSNISELDGHGMSINILTGSVLLEPGILAINTSQNNLLVGDTSQWTIEVRSHDNWCETGTTNRTFAPGLSGTTGSPVNGWSFVGAITQRGKFSYSGNKVDFSILIGAATSTAWTAGATIPTLPGVATDSFSCTVTDASSGTLIGMGVVGAGSGASTATLTVAQTATAHSIIVSGSYFVA